MNEPTKIDVTLQISSVKTIKFSVNNTEEIRTMDRLGFNFNISFASSIEPSKKIIAFDILVDIYTEKELLNKVSELASRIEYMIMNFDDLIKNINNQLVIPDQLMIMLTSISLSTTRGILAAKLEGSALEGVHLPVIDPKSFKPLNFHPINKQGIQNNIETSTK